MRLDEVLSGHLNQELRVKGTLDASGRQKIDMILHKEFVPGEDLLVHRNDRYSFVYASPIAGLILGDHRFEISPLLTPPTLERGAQGARL